jgi:enoyl-CoA hydratase/carnithine racemase
VTNSDLITYRSTDGVAIIGFNRPDQFNGMTGDMEMAYFTALLEAQADPDVRAIVVTGEGRSFCPGADLATSDGELPLPNPAANRCLPLEIRKPMIAAINGACAGIGIVYALQCDVRFLADEAKLTTAFARRGLIAEYGMAWLLMQTVGRAAALELLLSARVVLAEEALSLGLVTKVSPTADVLDDAIAYAADLAANCSPASMAGIKQQVNVEAFMSAHEATAHADGLMHETIAGVDVREGITSFFEKRQVEFPPLGAGTQFTWMAEANPQPTVDQEQG